ncbi:hypothetical protein ONS95_004570 [Cadophora gregata]|uniref:uncharacterized protein n=1 Tax=Cadophora gregata TaxID=51156 RepID=UPI0026DDC4FB|nr:uncharacterized protein ONS95_004570 [Cadophora gregata]KAK0105065.1 hypothetical protein ONS96_004468 [Cadophora gregata f. sp. sojae]KAK0106065.1 hypothetical protein ONS95_004570 [Cadophora gregata]
MPGVPSGRGCEACRKQKKKCDQAKPSCSRCTRLEIPCIGSGQRRFKFVDESQSQVVVCKPKSDPSSPRPQLPAYERISWSPSNDSTMIMGAFCSALRITDVRYDLGVYGTFIKDIPRRLGTNAALDASVRAVTSTYSAVHTRSKTVESLEHYVDALEVLRNTLNDPVEAGSANTLCAMYLMMVCQVSTLRSLRHMQVQNTDETLQGWVGEKDDCTSHGEAFAYLLSNVKPQDFQATFEDELLMTLCVPVIVESIAKPNIQLHPWLEKLTQARDAACPMQSLKLGNMAKISEFISNPQGNLVEMQFIYGSMAPELAKIRAFLANIVEAGDIDRTIHSRYQTVYGIQLSFAMILNVLLRSFSVDNFMGMLDECTLLVSETITLAEDARQYRPLGSSGAPTTLVCAWAATSDMAQRKRAEELMDEYQADFAIANWKEIARWIERKLNDGCLSQCLPELTTLGTQMAAQDPIATPQECIVM